MCEGYSASEGDYWASGLDEFLCEYVDGTMDPVVRRVFEDYLHQNPQLIEHIECLRHTRSMLCLYGCRMRAPDALQERLHARLARESVSCEPRMQGLALNLQWIVGLSSVLLLAFGILSGGQIVEEQEVAAVVGGAEALLLHAPHLQPIAVFDNVSAASLASVPIVSRRTPVRVLHEREPARSDSFLTALLPAQGGVRLFQAP